ncbi:MAG: alpha/beta hydrolase, partial [Pseudomonadota bacterium]
PLLARIKARTLIVHGDRDPLYPLNMAVELYESIPDAQLWVVPGGGHVPVFGNIGPEFVRLATEFLAPAVEC